MNARRASLKKGLPFRDSQKERVFGLIRDIGYHGATRVEIVRETGIVSHSTDKCLQMLIDEGRIRKRVKPRVNPKTGRDLDVYVALPGNVRQLPEFAEDWVYFNDLQCEAQKLREEKERNHAARLELLAKIDRKARRLQES